MRLSLDTEGRVSPETSHWLSVANMWFSVVTALEDAPVPSRREGRGSPPPQTRWWFYGDPRMFCTCPFSSCSLVILLHGTPVMLFFRLRYCCFCCWPLPILEKFWCRADICNPARPVRKGVVQVTIVPAAAFILPNHFDVIIMTVVSAMDGTDGGTAVADWMRK